MFHGNLAPKPILGSAGILAERIVVRCGRIPPTEVIAAGRKRSLVDEQARDRLWLLPRPHKNADGSRHINANQLGSWIRAWVDAIPAIEAIPMDGHGEAVPFDRNGITPHAFRHTYAQTLADEGVEASVLRDLMDHRNLATTLGYYRVSEKRKRQAMELVARHNVDNRGTIRPGEEPPSRVAELREQLSWVAVPMGKCSEPTNVRAGGQGCPIRCLCAGCPHFESDPSYLPDLRAYADELRREREVLLALVAASWVIDNVAGQLGVIVEHVRRHEQMLDGLSPEQGDAIDDASRTVSQGPPVGARGLRSPQAGRRRWLKQRCPGPGPTAGQPGQAGPGGRSPAGDAGDGRGDHLRSPPGRRVGLPALRRQGRDRQGGPRPGTASARPGRTGPAACRRARSSPSRACGRIWPTPRSRCASSTRNAVLLRHRLARSLGAEVDVARGQATAPLLDQLEGRAAELEADNAALRRRVAGLGKELREAVDSLEAARVANRDLMTLLNR